jgi:hypothetical protein
MHLPGSPDSGYSSSDSHSPTPSHHPYLDLELLFLELDFFMPRMDLDRTGIVFPPSPLAVQGQDVSFILQAGPHLATTLDSFVTGPSGHRWTVKMIFVPELQGFSCTFRPLEIGLNVGVVMAGAVHLPGSPFSFNVSRNYTPMDRTIITMDLELDPYGHANVRKPWGITTNTRTEEVSSFILHSFGSHTTLVPMAYLSM